jgi:hypothetical protein
MVIKLITINKFINMKKVYRNNLSGNVKQLLIAIFLLFGLSACKEEARFEIGYSDSEPPAAPEYIDYKPLYGGARLFYKIPADEDVLSIDAVYTGQQGQPVWFSVSYFTDSIDVYGFSDSTEHVVRLYAVDRAGNKSDMVDVRVVPLEPAYERAAKSVKVIAGFSSFYVDWVNELEQNINIYVDFSYTRGGQTENNLIIYTSMLEAERWFIRDLEDVTEPIRVRVRVEDMYGNTTDYLDKGEIVLLHDEIIPKNKWSLWEPNDSIGGVPMGYLEYGEARKEYIMDGIIDDSENVNYIHTGGHGRTGLNTGVGSENTPWNIMIDLGGEYEISRIVTHQRYYTGTYPTTGRGWYYGQNQNVAVYSTYIWDADRETWEYIMRYKISIPRFSTDIEYMHAGREGDMAYLYPDEPQFSQPTSRFRYEAHYSFRDNYTYPDPQCLSEITLYGRKAGTQ